MRAGGGGRGNLKLILICLYFVVYAQGDVLVTCVRPTAGIQVTTIHTANRLEITRLHTKVVYSQVLNRLTILVMSHGKVRYSALQKK